MKLIALTVLFILTTGGASAQLWNSANGIPKDFTVSIVENGGRLFAASFDITYLSEDGGKNWRKTPGQPKLTATIVKIVAAEGVLMLATDRDGVIVSSDQGETWKPRNNGLSGWSLIISDIAMLGDSIVVATGGNGVFVAKNDGLYRWDAMSSGLDEYGCISLIVHKNSLVLGTGSYTYRKARNSVTWEYLVLDSTVWQRPATAYCDHDGALFAMTFAGVYRSTDLGSTWTRHEIPFLRNLTGRSFASHGKRLFASLDFHGEHFIISSDDQGLSWTPRSHELMALNAMAIINGRMWVAREDGLWSADPEIWSGVSESSKPVPRNPMPLQCYPNPFNPATTLRFEIGFRTPARLDVVDLLGRTVATVFDGVAGPGVTEHRFDASQLASGMYMARLRTPHGVTSQKLLLQR